MLPDTRHRGDDEWQLGVHAETVGLGMPFLKLPESASQEREVVERARGASC